MYKIIRYYEEYTPAKGKVKKQLLYREGFKSKAECVQFLQNDNLSCNYLLNGNRMDIKKVNKAGIPYTETYKFSKSK